MSTYYTGYRYADYTQNIGRHDFCALNRSHHAHAAQACICHVLQSTGGNWQIAVGVDESVTGGGCGCGAVCIR